MVTVRQDLLDAHEATWDALGRPGSWWSGPQRIQLAEVVRDALADREPLPPWVAMSATDRRPMDPLVPDAALDVAYRIARSAGTITESVARTAMEATGPLAYVELCGIVSSVAAVVQFHRSVGHDLPPFPAATVAEPTGEQPAEIVDAELNWVPVAAPADELPAVVQAYSGVPIAMETTWRLAAAQYIPIDEMVDAEWMRRPDGLTRPESELVAARVAQLRECFY